MAVTKQGLVKAAQRAFLDMETRGSTWWGYPNVTNEDEFYYCKTVFTDCDSKFGSDGEYSVWLLLIVAESVA